MDEYEAANQWLQKRLNLPTEKTSFEISRDFEARQRAHAFFSARVAEGHILERLRGISDAYSRGEIGLAEARTRLKKFLRGEGTSDLPGRHLASHRSEVLAYRLRAADVLEHGSGLVPLVDEIVAENGDHQVRRDELALVVHEHHTVSVTIIDDTHIRAGLLHQSLKRLDILRNQRVRLVVREVSVKFFEYVGRLIAENLTGVKA